MNDYVGLLAGVAAAGIGGELFVRGAVGLAHWARISPGIIGATVAAFATSSPELSVSVNSALAGTPEIALGDALGSNVVNIALVLALALVIAGIQSPRDSVRRDFPVALLVPVVTGVLFLDGVLSRVDGLLMLALFAAWLSAAVMEARRQRSAAESVMGAPRVGAALASGAVGLGFLVLAGNIIVIAAKGIATTYGIDEFIIGATVVAIGTSTPELATTVIAKLRGHDEVSLGTILGSNIFNGLLIVPIAAVIHPIAIGWREVMVALVCGLIAVAVTWPPRSGFISRRRGVVLLALYAVYIVAIAQGLTS
ncbi:calcium/sodium antiporter [Aromatoleum toluclasticum]|uniref:calcium/sodium antiporter n=1 Tax=Aromatoleum toluclasticum TaxID=92003 RepID=UPI001D186F2B|nr:calcium/sodium antiporter [Aromatoleum toluclasticum]MCC4116016.1 calcium/sodium antiporter [Aromatoleum toluclasticum]